MKQREGGLDSQGGGGGTGAHEADGPCGAAIGRCGRASNCRRTGHRQKAAPGQSGTIGGRLRAASGAMAARAARVDRPGFGLLFGAPADANDDRGREQIGRAVTHTAIGAAHFAPHAIVRHGNVPSQSGSGPFHAGDIRAARHVKLVNEALRMRRGRQTEDQCREAQVHEPSIRRSRGGQQDGLPEKTRVYKPNT